MLQGFQLSFYCVAIATIRKKLFRSNYHIAAKEQPRKLNYVILKHYYKFLGYLNWHYIKI